MTKNFKSVTEALEADVKAVRLKVAIAGKIVTCFEAHPSHGVAQPIGTCAVVLEAPLPAGVAFNATVTVQAGYPGAARTVFSGRIPAHSAAIDEQGRFATVNAVGWASLLDYPDYADLRFPGPMSLKRVFQALCKRRRVPSYRSEEVLSIAGSVIALGGVDEVDDGDVLIPRDLSPLQWLAQKAELFGYAVFDTPIGRVVQQRVSGLPTAAAAATYAEGDNAYRFQRDSDTAPMVTYWEVKGARYTANADGRTVAVRSIPASVPYAAELDPPGYRKGTKQDEALVTQALADAARNVLETNYSEPSETTTWEVDGAPDRQPGDVVTVDSDTCQCAGSRWLTSIQQSVSDTQGYYATMTGWTGSGSALPAGDDCQSSSVGSGSYHVGDDTLANYADPTPDGSFLATDDPVRTVVIAFTAPDDASSVTFEAMAHSTNSHLTEEDDKDSTLSTWEVWQLPDPTLPEDADNKKRRVGSGDLPVMASTDGDYAGDAALWQAIVIPVTGSLVAGAAELRLLSGHNPTTGGYDDYEVTSLTLIVCGVGQPDLPNEGAV